MKIQLLIYLIGLYNFLSINGRLIPENKTKNVENPYTEKPNPSIRLTRNIEDDSLKGFSEESFQSDEFMQSYNRRANYFFATNSPTVQALKRNRFIRDSVENLKAGPKSKNHALRTKEPGKSVTKPNVVLVKKPIPKFIDTQYYDFQSKISNARARVIADSGEHEDEDFNLDDYEFDINHDEFNSGRKPLEPRWNTKIKEGNTKNLDKKTKSNLISLESSKPVTSKKQRAADNISRKSIDKIKNLDNDDTSTVKVAVNDTKLQDNEYWDESKEVKQDSSVRKVRSWNFNLFPDKVNDKASRVITRILSVLPLFPQIPKTYQT